MKRIYFYTAIIIMLSACSEIIDTPTTETATTNKAASSDSGFLHITVDTIPLGDTTILITNSPTN